MINWYTIKAKYIKEYLDSRKTGTRGAQRPVMVYN